MEFYDVVTITVKSWRGGDWIATGRREKHVPFGWPSWWDWGNWGSIILEWARNAYTLLPFRMQRVYKAKHWEHGKGKDKYGRAAEDRVLLTPFWTVVRDKETGHELGVIEHEGQQIVLAQGWRGWLGNKHFVSAEKQFSSIALLWEPGNKRDIVLELRLLSDIALIGVPSVGKSSIINMIANTKAKTAEYHFTTLIPNMGMVGHKDKTFSVIDIPGLIEGASSGKWLGNAFLRHIVKSKLLLFVLDAGKYETGMDDVGLLFEELRQYVSETIFNDEPDHIHTVKCTKYWIEYSVHHEEELVFHKFIWFIINKVDIINDEEILADYTTTLIEKITDYFNTTFKAGLTKKQTESYCIAVSAATTQWKDELLDYMVRCIAWMEKYEDSYEEPTIPFEKKQAFQDTEDPIKRVNQETLDMLLENEYIDEETLKKHSVWQLDNGEIAYLTFVLPWGNYEAELWFWGQLAQKGYLDEWEKVGFKKGDIIQIISPYAGIDNRFIVWE